MQPVTPAVAPAYIHRGVVVDKKPFSLVGLLLAMVNAIVFFVTSMLGRGTTDDHTHAYKRKHTPGGYGGGGGSGGNGGSGGGRPGSNIHGVSKPATAAPGGCASCGS